MNLFMKKTSITKSILTSALLIIIGLSVSANRYVSEYRFDDCQVVSPSKQTATDAGIFSGTSGDMFGGRPQRIFGDDPDDPLGGGTGNDNEGFNDGGSGSGGGGFGDDDDDPFDPGGGDDPDCGYNDCPVGNGICVLFLLAVAYAGYLFRKKTAITVS